MKWGDGQPFETKLERLLQRIDELNGKGHTVSLVAASAGAGAAINAFARRKDAIKGVVCIAGKINHPETIGSGYKSKNADFYESAQLVPASLSELDDEAYRTRIMSRYAMVDLLVPKRDSVVPGAHNVMVITSGHALTIATQLFFGAPIFLRFLKEIARH